MLAFVHHGGRSVIVSCPDSDLGVATIIYAGAYLHEELLGLNEFGEEGASMLPLSLQDDMHQSGSGPSDDFSRHKGGGNSATVSEVTLKYIIDIAKAMLRQLVAQSTAYGAVCDTTTGDSEDAANLVAKESTPAAEGDPEGTKAWGEKELGSEGDAALRFFEAVRTVLPALDFDDERVHEIADSVASRLCRVRGRSFDGAESRDLLVQLDNTILAFASKVLLQRTSIILERGRRYGLIGQNGVGKTTLLDRLAAKDIHGFPESVNVYYIQHEILAEDKGLTVIGYMQRELKEESDEGTTMVRSETFTIEEALTEVGFDDEAQQQPVANLSGGWRMRLAIARSMLYEATLLLLDEPTNHLDVDAVGWLAGHLTSLEGTTIVLVSHDYEFLERVTTNVIHMADQCLKYFDGTFRAFQKANPEIVAALPKPTRLARGGGNLQDGQGGMLEMDGFKAALSALDQLQDGTAALGGDKEGPETESGGDAEAKKKKKNILPILLPNPGRLQDKKRGVVSRGKGVMTTDDLTFTYEGSHDKGPVLRDVSVKVSLNSRCAILGANGAGKSTLMKLLVGELQLASERSTAAEDLAKAVADAADVLGSGAATAETDSEKNGDLPAEEVRLHTDKGSLYRHHNLRTAYIAQHSMHHLESNIELTPLQYIQRRFWEGRDKEFARKVTVKLTSDEEALMAVRGEVCGVISRVNRGKALYYELEKTGRKHRKDKWGNAVEQPKVYMSLAQIRAMGKPHVLKLVRMYDEELKAAESGMSVRPLTGVEMTKHLAEFGISEDLATRKIRWMSGGQKCRLVLAAAMWTVPHVIALDEPTNYLDNDTLAALTHALRYFGGGVVTISHNEAFIEALCNEKWHITGGSVRVELIERARPPRRPAPAKADNAKADAGSGSAGAASSTAASTHFDPDAQKKRAGGEQTNVMLVSTKEVRDAQLKEKDPPKEKKKKKKAPKDPGEMLRKKGMIYRHNGVDKKWNGKKWIVVNKPKPMKTTSDDKQMARIDKMLSILS